MEFLLNSFQRAKKNVSYAYTTKFTCGLKVKSIVTFHEFGRTASELQAKNANLVETKTGKISK